jgi:CDP-glycerol glycerophosphotransferase (TagB/SpsB family)
MQLEKKKRWALHLEDLIDKIDRDYYQQGQGFYDDYDGTDNNGEHYLRNTSDLVASLKEILDYIEG